jgi:hypothetical protein
MDDAPAHWLVTLPAALAASPAASAAQPGCAVLLQMPALLGAVKKRGVAYYLKDAAGGYMQRAVEGKQLACSGAQVAPGGQLLLTVPAARGDYTEQVGWLVGWVGGEGGSWRWEAAAAGSGRGGAAAGPAHK